MKSSRNSRRKYKDTSAQIWDSLSPAEQANLLKLTEGIPTEAGLVKLLIQLSATQLKQTFGKKSRVAIVGPANVGKSTLYNQFVHKRDEAAKVSPLPGTTRVNQESDAGLFTIVDTPGADAVGDVGRERKDGSIACCQGCRLPDYFV